MNLKTNLLICLLLGLYTLNITATERKSITSTANGACT